MKIINLSPPISSETIASLRVGDTILFSGQLLCGRDAVLPMVTDMIRKGTIANLGIDLNGQAIFYTAVSLAGVGPTSINKPEIEDSMELLSAAGIKLHLGKGKLQEKTIQMLNRFNSVYAIIPPVTALLKKKTHEERTVAFSELGMEALHLIRVENYPAIIGAAHGRSIYAK